VISGARDLVLRPTQLLLCGAFAAALVPSACGGETSGEPMGHATAGSGGTDDGLDAGTLESAGFCAPYCAKRADCCIDCTYPNDLDCRDRHCVSLGCVSDYECRRVEGPASFCRAGVGVRRCERRCGSDADCSDDKPVCVIGNANESFCARLPGLQIPCFNDSQCAGKGVCDVKRFTCGCSRDDQCPVGKVCVPPL
jgi:hypothetical protein